MADPACVCCANKWASSSPSAGREPETLSNVMPVTRSAPRKETAMAYRIAGVDVHKKMLAVVIADIGVEGE